MWVIVSTLRILGPCRRRRGGTAWHLMRGGGGWLVAHLMDRNPGGGGVGTRPRDLIVCLLAAPIGLSPLLILTLCGPERVLVVSTEPPDDLSCFTTPGVSRPGDGAVAHAVVPRGGEGVTKALSRVEARRLSSPGRCASVDSRGPLDSVGPKRAHHLRGSVAVKGSGKRGERWLERRVGGSLWRLRIG